MNSPIIFPDALPIKLSELISLPKALSALLQAPQIDVFISERLSSFMAQPAGALLDHSKITRLPLVDKLPFAVAASVHDAELSLLVMTSSKVLCELHNTVARGSHSDVDILASIRGGVLFTFRPCITASVDRGAPLFLKSREVSKFCSNLIASPSRVRAVASSFVASSNGVRTRAEFEDHIRTALPHAKPGDIHEAWNSPIVPADWHVAGRRPKSRR